MRVLFSALAAPGHTFPLIPLAVALQDAGHQVLFATGKAMHPALRAAGLRTREAGLDIGAAFGVIRSEGIDPRALSGEQIETVTRRVFGDLLPRRFGPDLVEVIDQERPDLMVRELGNLGAGFAADRRELPIIVHGFGLVLGGIGRMPPEDFRALAADLGVPEPRDPGELPTVDICPPSLRPTDLFCPAHRLPLRPLPHRTPGLVQDMGWRRHQDLIYLTLGTAFGSVAVLRQAVDGLSRLPVDVLVSTGPSVPVEALGDLPAHVRAESWVQQAEVLQQATLVVHHGGSGTTLAAAAAGARQLLLPQGADQFVNADAVVAAGSGRRLTDALTPDTLVTAAEDLMTTPSYADAAARLADEIATMPAPDTVADQVVAWLT